MGRLTLAAVKQPVITLTRHAGRKMWLGTTSDNPSREELETLHQNSRRSKNDAPRGRNETGREAAAGARAAIDTIALPRPVDSIGLPPPPHDQMVAATPQGTKYRPEIDGLRAVAVVLVLLFHAGWRALAGGFVGVDVFFVISGYLITQIVIADAEAARFSVAGFYERRARRILPALFTVVAACVMAGIFLMAPSQLKGLAESVAAVALSASNFLFFRTTGYFDGGVEALPLIHTWSLAVEEQFYLLFPILVTLLWRRARNRLLPAIILIAVLSFAWCIWAARVDPAANFYLAPSRAWELLLGAVLAEASRRVPLHLRVAPAARETLSVLGLVAILGSAITFTSATPFPSEFALLPTIGSALVLAYAVPQTFVGRMLSARPLVRIGLISYSLYLWHQPLFAFARIVTVGETPSWTFAVLTACSFALAYLTWRYIEAPFRNRRFLSRKRVFVLAAAGSAFFVFLGAGRYYADRNFRFSYVRRINYGLGIECEYAGDFVQKNQCSTSPNPRILIWGDSFAMHIVPGFIASDSAVSLTQATRSLCGPILDAAAVSTTDRSSDERTAEACRRFTASVMDYAIRQTSVKTVVMSSPFEQYVDSSRFDLLTDAGRQHASVDLAAKYLDRTIQRLRDAGKQVVIVAPPPGGSFDMGNCVERQQLGKPIWGELHSCEIDRSDYLRRYARPLELIAQVEMDMSVPVIRFDSVLCDDARCLTSIEGTSIYRDESHLSYDGSAFLGRALSLTETATRVAR